MLALPKLNLQYLTFHDYLLRNFNLFRLESTYEIRQDVQVSCVCVCARARSASACARSVTHTQITRMHTYARAHATIGQDVQVTD